MPRLEWENAILVHYFLPLERENASPVFEALVLHHSNRHHRLLREVNEDAACDHVWEPQEDELRATRLHPVEASADVCRCYSDQGLIARGRRHHPRVGNAGAACRLCLQPAWALLRVQQHLQAKENANAGVRLLVLVPDLNYEHVPKWVRARHHSPLLRQAAVNAT